MDVRIKEEEGIFKHRVSGIIINEDKMLTVMINKNGFRCLPGGHVHLGEDTMTAVKREIQEEVEIEAEEISLFAIVENFFTNRFNQVVHELGYYYIIKPKQLGKKAEDYVFVENDQGELIELNFKWVKFDDIDKVDFRPQILVEKLKNKDFSFKHIIYKQN